MSEKLNITELENLVKQLQEENKELKSKRQFGLIFENKKEELPLEIESGVMFFEGFFYNEINIKNELLENCLKSNGSLKQDIKNINNSEILYNIKGTTTLSYESKYYIQFKQTDIKYYPNLVIKDKFINSDLAPINYLIEGDNYHALKLLLATHKNSIDVIYIDPPYNTGGEDFKYNDKYIGSEDTYKHSKWLSFMEKRLKISKNLLTESGVVIISIDDNEYAKLHMLVSQIFGESNIETMIWEKVGDGNASAGKMKTTHRFRIEHEYVLVCYKNKDLLTFNKTMEKPSFIDKEKNPDKDIRGNWESGNISKAKSNENGKNYYEVTSPSGNKITRQWHFDKNEFDRLNKDNRIYWGESGNNIPRLKIFMQENREVTPTSILLKKGSMSMGKKELGNIIDKELVDKFTPKPLKLLTYLLTIVSNKNAVVLDFFAGSGTTGHAVAELNKKDGGSRQYILCTNNEKNIAEEMTFERLKRISNPSDYELKINALPHNLIYKKITAISEEDLTADKLVELLKLQEGCEITIPFKDLQCYTNYDKSIVFNFVDTDKDQLEEFIELNPKATILYEQDEDLDDQMKSLKNKFPEIDIKFIPNKIITALKKGE